MNISRIQDLVRAKGNDVEAPDQEWLDRFGRSGDSDVARQYLEHCIPREGYLASGISMKDRRGLEDENLADAAPGMYLFAYGYMVIGTSVGANAVCLDARSTRVFWANHASFNEFGVNYKDASTGDWVDLEYSDENVRRALVEVAEDAETFLIDLLNDRLEAQLDRLD